MRLTHGTFPCDCCLMEVGECRILKTMQQRVGQRFEVSWLNHLYISGSRIYVSGHIVPYLELLTY